MLSRHALVLAGLALVHTAHAQLVPDRAYYGVGRPVPMHVRVPADAPGEARIDLYEPGQELAVASAPVISGGVNLASLLPSLWDKKAPKVQYAQLVVGEMPVGAPVVLTPMINPPIGQLFDAEAGKVWLVDPVTGKPNDADPRRARVVYTPDEAPCYAGVHAYIEQHAVFDTSLGEIEFRFRPDSAPQTVDNFRRLAQGGFYTDIAFHRIAAVTKTGDPFVVQVGDPSGTGDGGPGYNIDLEDSKLPHDFGVLSMARNTDPNTNGSQVFICLSREGTARLDGKYTAFAQAIRGAETILALAATPVRTGTDRPETAPVLLGVRLIDAPPYGSAAAPLRRPGQTSAPR